MRRIFAPVALAAIAASGLATQAAAQAPDWKPYKAISLCASTMSELVDTPHLHGKTAPTADPMVLHVRWRNGTEHLLRVGNSSASGYCLEGWRPIAATN